YQPGVAGDAEIDAAVVAKLAVVEIDLNDDGVGGQALAVTEAEVEGRADDHDLVRVSEGLTPRAVEEDRVPGGQGATGGPVEIDGGGGAPRDPGEGGGGPQMPHLPPGQETGPLRQTERSGAPIHGPGVAAAPPRRTILARVDHRLLVHGGE